MNDTNTPAFPTGLVTDHKGVIVGGSNGMTLRDYFAAKAMQGLYSSSYYNESYAALSEMAYKQADAMLEAREL